MLLIHPRGGDGAVVGCTAAVEDVAEGCAAVEPFMFCLATFLPGLVAAVYFAAASGGCFLLSGPLHCSCVCVWQVCPSFCNRSMSDGGGICHFRYVYTSICRVRMRQKVNSCTLDIESLEEFAAIEGCALLREL